VDDGLAMDDVVDVARPAKRTNPLVFASPHSGRIYPQAFIDSAKLDPLTLRRSEDAFVDEIFGVAPDHGAPLLRALFPRAYVDPNREPWELDPRMFRGDLPAQANIGSPRISAGLGTIAKVVTSGDEIYADKLDIEEGLARIHRYYEPYHATLRGLIQDTIDLFGVCLLIDCHSMPSIGGPMDLDPGSRRVDMVLGDCHGASCGKEITDFVDQALTDMRYNVKRNDPYAGGFVTSHYGVPRSGVHALQIEINRALYMREGRMERSKGFAGLQADMGRLVESLTKINTDFLAPAR